MAISFVGTATGSAANGGNPTATLSDIAGLAEDDFVVICAGYSTAGGDMTVASGLLQNGWTLLAELFSNDTNSSNLGVWAKFMGSTPDTTVAYLGDLGATSSGVMVATAFRGVDKTYPFDVAGVTATGIDSSNADPPSITLSGASGVWTVICAVGGEGNTASGVFTFPTNYTTNASQAQQNDSLSTIAGIGYNSSPSATENPGAFTDSSSTTSNSWCAYTFALRPSPVDYPITLVGSAEGSAINGGDVTLTLPTCLENDLVVVAGTHPQAFGAMTMATGGYTQITYIQSTADTVDSSLGVFYKKMGSTPDTTAVLDGTGDVSEGIAAVALVFRGVDTATPLDVTTTTDTGVNSGNADPPSLDFSDANAMILAAGATAHTTGGSAGYTLPSNYIGIQATGDDTREGLVGLGYLVGTLSGDPANPTAFLRESRNVDVTHSWAAATIALRSQPEPSAPTPIPRVMPSRRAGS